MASIRPIDKNQIHLSQIFALSEFSNDLSISKVEAILNNGFNVNYVLPVDDSVNYEKTKPDLLGCSALHFVVKNPWLNRVKILDLLLTKGADFTHKNHDGLTPLCLLFYRFVINNFMYEYSTCEAMINRLLLAHYESNNTDNPHCKNGISHFHIACIAKNVKMAKFYLEAGVPVNLAIHNTSKIIPGFTPLHIAIRNKDIDMIRLLLEHGTDYTCLNANGMSILHLLSDEHCRDDFFTKINERYDNEALKNSHILGFLSQVSTNDFNPLDQIGFTKLHMYCIRHDNAERLEDLQGYLKRDDNINATISKDSPLWPGYSPLHFATHCRKKMILLLKNGADFLAKDANGITPLDFCIKNKCKLISISCILKNYSALNPVQSRNTILIDFLRALKTTDSLSEYLNKVNVNTAIPCNSLLWPGYTLLHLAVVLSDEFHRKKVNLCLKEGVDITVKDANGLTALELAFQMKKTGHVSAILEAYADDSHEIDKQNIKLFHIACAYRNEVVVKKFLSAGFDPDTPLLDDFKILLKSYHDRNQKGPLNLGHTPLLNAVYDFWSKDLAKLLLEFKADPHIVDADGFTWIHRSFFGFNSYHDSRNLLLPLIKAKKSNLIAPGGLSYLHIACYAGTTSIIKSLLTSKNVNEPITSELLKYIKHPPGFISVGDTPLHFAVKGGNEKNVMFLLRNGANAGAKNADSLTPLHVALTSTRCRLKTNLVIKRLYEKSCRKCNVDEVGFTPLHVACAQQDAAWIDKLLRDGGDIDSQINSDSPIWPSYTPVDIISNKYFYEKNVNAMNVLLSYIVTKVENSTFAVQELHAQPKRRKITSSKDSKDTFDTKLLLFAFHNKCMGRQYDVVEKLIKLGVDVNAPKNCFTVCDAGYTPLHFAVKYGSKNVIEVLVQHGADVTLEDPQGYTPLHLAAEKFPDKLEILLSTCRLNLEMKNTFGQTLMNSLSNNRNAHRRHFLNLLQTDASQNISLSTKMCLLKTLFKKYSGKSLESLINYIPNVNDVDENGDNIFHHLASSTFEFDLNFSQFVNNIKLLIEKGCEIDQQNRYGQTPLHSVILSNNLPYLQALIGIGVDVNIRDASGNTAYMYCYEDGLFDNINEHICKINDAGLYLDPLNKKRCESLNSPENSLGESPTWSTLLFIMEKMDITKSITLRDVLTDEMVMRFPLMPLNQRQAILEYINSDFFHIMFWKWVPVFKMQERKARKRLELFGPAVISLQDLLDPRLPVHCIETILIQLNNDEWNNVIRAKNIN